MPAEAADELTPLLARLGLSKYTKLLVDDEELTTGLLKTMEKDVAHESLCDVGLDAAASQKLCDAVFGGDDDALELEDNDDDALELEDNEAGADDDDDDLVMEDNAAATGNGNEPPPPKPSQAKPAAPAPKAAPEPAPKPAPKPSTAPAPAASPKQQSLQSRYNKWDAFEDEEEEDANMEGAVREFGRYEIVEKMVYCMDTPNPKASILEVKNQGETVLSDARKVATTETGKVFEWIRLKELVKENKTGAMRKGWMMVDATNLGRAKLGLLLKKVAQQKKKTFDYSKWDKFIDEQEDLDMGNEQRKPAHMTPGYNQEALVGMNPAGQHSLGRGWSEIQDGEARHALPGMEAAAKAMSEAEKGSGGSGKKSSSSSKPSPFAPSSRVQDVTPTPVKEEAPMNPQAAQLKEMAQGFDNAGYQEHRIKELEMTKERFGSAAADSQLQAEAVMRDAKAQGNQGNLVMDPETGRMVIKTEDEMGGKADKYWWGQSEKEVTIKCKVPASTKGRHVQLTSKSQAVRLVVDGQTICEGPLHRPVIADESLYTLEDAPKGEEGRILTVTMTKATPTKGQEHWTCAIKGQARADKKSFGISTVTVNPNDPAEMQRVMASLNKPA